MRGFVAGSLVLIVLQVLLRPGSASRVAEGGNVFTAGIRRLLSGDIAGIPQRKATTAAPPAAAGGGF